MDNHQFGQEPNKTFNAKSRVNNKSSILSAQSSIDSNNDNSKSALKAPPIAHHHQEVEAEEHSINTVEKLSEESSVDRMKAKT